jgi:serine/threonine-protein kinase
VTLNAGTKLGPYEIVSPLGAGGMGEVYRARDTKLNRDVALKVLPEVFTRNTERMARFQREAQVLASLNHPNIAAIYGLEESGGVRALVMELVEGPTLAERIPQRGTVEAGLAPPRAPQGVPLQIDESLPIAKQIAEGLEYAHERGVIHRDLKPANVKVSPDGTVKILDLGLAKALDPQTPAPGVGAIHESPLPTISAAATREGMILGTAAYMSPEQARGKTVDRRADIWAFGVVLYEMFTGQRLFGGETVSDTLAAVITKEPDWEALPASTSPGIRQLLRRCLTKDPRSRLQAIGDARIVIEETLSGAGDVGAIHESPLPRPAPPPAWRRALPWTLAAILALVLLALTISNALRPPVPPKRPVTRLVVNLPPTDHLALGFTPVLAMSPDGLRLVYVAKRGGSTQLYLRSMDRFEATPIPGTEGAETPFFSPDGQSVGFFAEGKLKTVSLSGGAPLTLCSAPLGRGASWGPDDTIIFVPSINAGLFRVPAAGGTPKPLTVPDRKKGQLSHRWPEILPGGKVVLFTIWTGAGGSFDKARIGVLSLETGEQRVLVKGGAYARYVPSGHVVYARGGGLLAVPFDPKRLEVTGSPVSILEGVSINPSFGSAEFSSSAEGSLAFVSGGSSVGDRTLLWVDRRGATRPLPTPPRAYSSPRLSPDGRRLAVAISDTNPGLWVYDVARGTLTRLTESTLFPFPIWMPDGKRLTLRLTPTLNIYSMPADGSGAAKRLTTSENGQYPGSWSPDGHVLAFSELDPTTGWDIWVLNLDGDGKPRPFLQTPSNEAGPILSPDGHWLAYQSDESGRSEIYVRPFPGPGGKVQISTEGGAQPVWARNGRELFYRNGDKMMAATVETKPTFTAAKPKLLFEGRYEAGIYTFAQNYDVSSDGQRFLMIKASEQESAATQVNVVLNWSEELRRLAPAGKP